MNNMQHQVGILLLGEQGSGKTWMAQKLVEKFDVTKVFSAGNILRNLAADPQVFNVATDYFSHEKKDVPFTFPIHIREMQIKRIIQRISALIPLHYQFNPNKIAVSNFVLPIIKTPRELLQFIAFEIFHKINPEYLFAMSMKEITGVPGIYVNDDVRTSDQVDQARQTLQMVFTVLVDGEKHKQKEKKAAAIPLYESLETDWRNVKSDFKIKNEFDEKKTEENLLKLVTDIDTAMKERIKSGNLAPLQKTVQQTQQDWVNQRGPIAQNMQAQKEIMFGKASFRQGEAGESPTPIVKIQDTFIPANQIDRSDLR